MTARPRYIEKFENYLGNISVTFPLRQYEWQSQQPMVEKLSSAIGADFAHDHYGYAPLARDPAREAVRFIVVGSSVTDLDSQLADIRSKCYRIGRGKLYTLDDNGVRRWAWARVSMVPGFQINTPFPRVSPMMLDFVRLSDWYDNSLTTGSQNLTATPTAFTITNPGNVAVKIAVFRLRANSATGFTNPRIQNLTNGYEIASTRDAASVNSELRIDAGRQQVEWSDDNGATYASDYANVTLGAHQVGLMNLEPGANSMNYIDGGTPDAVLEWSFPGANI